MKNDEGRMPNDEPKAEVIRCTKCGGTGELQTRLGVFDCPDCDGTGEKARVIRTTHAAHAVQSGGAR